MSLVSGARSLCRTLEAGGVDTVFALPGTQTLALHEELRRSRVRVVLATDELAAAFMAIGYYRASGRLAPLVTIAGPGFAYAIAGLAEARHDSSALLHIVGPHTGDDRHRRLQSLDHLAIATLIAKACRRIDTADAVAPVLSEAMTLALGGEPGPVVVEWRAEALSGRSSVTPLGAAREEKPAPERDVAAIAARLASAVRPLLYAGQGCLEAAATLRELAEWLGAPVVTTLSGRGVIPEDHPLAVPHDLGCGGIRPLNRLLGRADLILAVGCRLAASATAGFRVHLPSERIIHVDANAEAGGWPVAQKLVAPAEAFLPALAARLRSLGSPASRWREGEIAQARRAVRRDAWPEPEVLGASPPTAAAFFHALRAALPRDAIVVADSGTHQILLRRHFDVLSSRGLIVPSDFQSMGFGLPAAIGARLAARSRPVVAIVGDGGFAMSGLELLTAVREQLALTVVVFADRQLNRIRIEQLARFGLPAATALHNPDFEAFARAVGARYVRCQGDARALADAVRHLGAGGPGGVTLVEVPVADSLAIHVRRARGLAREAARRALEPWTQARPQPGPVARADDPVR